MTDPLVDAPSRSPAPTGRRRRRPRLRYVVVAAVLAGALAFLLTKMGGALDYYETVDQAVAHKVTLGAQTFRLQGVVLPGTVHRTAHGVDFVAGGSKYRVEVVNSGNPPQLFQPGIPVIVAGHFSGSTFVSTQIIVDHTANYTEVHPKPVRAARSLSR